MNEISTQTTPRSIGFTKAEIARGVERLQFATFYLGRDLFGIYILQVQEILLDQPITPTPLAAPHVLGLLGLRGQIVTAIDLKKRIGMKTSKRVADPYHLVVNAGDSSASLLVDRIGDVLELPAADFNRPPDSLKGIDPQFLEGVFMLEERILAVIDLQAVLEVN